MPTLDLNSDIVCAIIEKAREFQAQEGVVIPDLSEEYSEEDYLQILARHKNDLTYQELVMAIDDLEPDQQMSLVALLYLGRGDFSLLEWEDALAAAEEGWTTHTAKYLLAKPHVADYLENGLEQLGYRCQE